MSTVSPSLNPYAAPSVSSESTSSSVQPTYGGISRLTYLFCAILVSVCARLILEFAQPYLGEMIRPAALGLLLVQLAVIGYLVALRHINLGYSPYWCLAMFVPIVNVLVGARCVLFPTGYAHHRKLDRYAIIALTILLGIPSIMICVVICSAFYQG